MAGGTKTKLLVAVLILINAVVLLNIRRASPELPGGESAHAVPPHRSTAIFSGILLRLSELG